MRMPGVPEELYVRARGALLDAAEALGPHLGAVVLVGAQAIYVHTGDADLAVAEYTTDTDLAVAPYTTDADFAVSPVELADEPLLETSLPQRIFSDRRIRGGGSPRTGSTSTSWSLRPSLVRAPAAPAWALTASK